MPARRKPSHDLFVHLFEGLGGDVGFVEEPLDIGRLRLQNLLHFIQLDPGSHLLGGSFDLVTRVRKVGYGDSKRASRGY